MLGPVRAVNFVLKRFFHQTSPVFRTMIRPPKGGPVPPDHPTCAYIPLPEHLEPQKWNFVKADKPRLMVLRYRDWRMQRDARRRETSTLYGPLRNRLNCVRKTIIFPNELRDIASEEINRLPLDSCRTRVVNRCIITSRPRGKKRRWRMSRIVFRSIADHGKMSGMKRAFWKSSFV